VTPAQLKAIREAFRKLSISLEADLPNDDIYELQPEEFDEKYSKEIVFAKLKRA
jgi:hypothetical protein